MLITKACYTKHFKKMLNVCKWMVFRKMAWPVWFPILGSCFCFWLKCWRLTPGQRQAAFHAVALLDVRCKRQVCFFWVFKSIRQPMSREKSNRIHSKQCSFLEGGVNSFVIKWYCMLLKTLCTKPKYPGIVFKIFSDLIFIKLAGNVRN